jgi:predicted DNA-binding WGR domain protein
VPAPSTVRWFEFSAGRSHKFREISAVATAVTVRFGRIGAAGQTRVKAFADAAAAGKHAARLIARKVKKGYVPVGRPRGAADRPRSGEALALRPT